MQGVSLYLYSDQEWPDFRELAGPGRVGLQRGADLGEKMLHCFKELSRRGHQRMLIVGSDSPTLPTDYLRAGLRLLGGANAVLGPCDDGGYYAVGCRSAKAGMFEGVSWSTASTLTETERAFERAGLTWERLPPWYDIDTIENLRRLVSEAGLPQRVRRWLEGNPGFW